MKNRVTAAFALSLLILGCGAHGEGDTFSVPLPNWRDQTTVPADTVLLAAEAERRGLANAYGVQRALRVAVAKIVVDEVFRPTTDPAGLKDEELEFAFKQNYWHFNKPPFVSLAHILFHAKAGKAEPEKQKLAQRLCEETLDAAKQAKSAAAFRALKAKVEGRGLPIIYEEFRTWPGKLEKPFEDVAYKMRTPGEVAGCVSSTYGSHIIYLYEFEPGVERKFADVKEEIRKNSADDFAARKFALWLKKLRATTRAALVPDILARLRKEPAR